MTTDLSAITRRIAEIAYEAELDAFIAETKPSEWISHLHKAAHYVRLAMIERAKEAERKKTSE